MRRAEANGQIPSHLHRSGKGVALPHQNAARQRAAANAIMSAAAKRVVDTGDIDGGVDIFGANSYVSSVDEDGAARARRLQREQERAAAVLAAQKDALQRDLTYHMSGAIDKQLAAKKVALAAADKKRAEVNERKFAVVEARRKLLLEKQKQAQLAKIEQIKLDREKREREQEQMPPPPVRAKPSSPTPPPPVSVSSSSQPSAPRRIIKVAGRTSSSATLSTSSSASTALASAALSAQSAPLSVSKPAPPSDPRSSGRLGAAGTTAAASMTVTEAAAAPSPASSSSSSANVPAASAEKAIVTHVSRLVRARRPVVAVADAIVAKIAAKILAGWRSKIRRIPPATFLAAKDRDIKKLIEHYASKQAKSMSTKET
jgi:hypothetical protein